MIGIDYSQLKLRQLCDVAKYPDSLSLTRSCKLSWIDRGESRPNNLYEQFIYLWIAFNADCSQNLECLNLIDTAMFLQLMAKMCDLERTQCQTESLGLAYFSKIKLPPNNQ